MSYLSTEIMSQKQKAHKAFLHKKFPEQKVRGIFCVQGQDLIPATFRVAVPENDCCTASGTTHFRPLPLLCLPSSAAGGGRHKTSYSPVVGLKKPEDKSLHQTSPLANKKLLGQKSKEFFWVQGPDLNQRPSGYEPDELPDCSTLRYLAMAQLKCRRPESNRYGFKGRRILSPVRLPVPPLRRTHCA